MDSHRTLKQTYMFFASVRGVSQTY